MLNHTKLSFLTNIIEQDPKDLFVAFENFARIAVGIFIALIVVFVLTKIYKLIRWVRRRKSA